MRIKRLEYTNDGKAQIRLNFGDLVIAVTFAVTVDLGLWRECFWHDEVRRVEERGRAAA